MEMQEFIDRLRGDPNFIRNVATWERLPARPAQYADFPSTLDARLVELVREQGLSPLYTHQAQAVDALLNNENVALVTGTASGKSLAYNLATLQFMLRQPDATALYLFPTKALAQDQAAALSELTTALDPPRPIPLNVYDGDTPQSHRAGIRREGGVIVSNPDMLHVGIMPYHSRWVKWFQNLRLVVLDEVHIYRGVFGSHMANVIRRLRRICQFYGVDPLFVCTSATIANPQEHAERLIEAPVTLVDEDGAPRGEKHIILYNPPTIDPHSGIRRSYTLESRALAGRLLKADVQTIVFARARLTTEILLGYIRDEAENAGIAREAIRGYRGGYLPLERREIERDLRAGVVRGVVATNALELGVDIGALGAAVLAGYPGTIASTWQQFGRAGRRADRSLGVLVASGAPLDQYIAAHPRYLFESSPEHALIDPDNLLILADHLRCAAYELPFESGEGFGMFEDAESVLSVLSEGGDVHHSGGLYRWISDTYPAADMSLRTGGADTVVIQDQTDEEPRVIGEVDRSSAPISVYEGAIYLHEDQQYQIESLDWEQGVASARATEADYYTNATSGTDVRVQEEHASELVGDCLKGYGHVMVTQQVSGYRIIKRYTHETLGYGEIDLPAQQFETTATWIALTPDLTIQLEAENVLLKPNDYGPNWAEQRDKTRARDEYRCTQCDMPERDRQQHDVHHIVPFRQFGYVRSENDHYREANRLENLVTLCRSCHRAVEAARGTRSALGGAANVMRNVATLMLMCSPNDIGIVTEQRSSYTKQPTVTVYDHVAGGIGLVARLYDLHDEFLSRALELVRDCPCSEGCPACVGPVGEVGEETKDLTIRLLEAMVSELTPTSEDDPPVF